MNILWYAAAWQNANHNKENVRGVGGSSPDLGVGQSPTIPPLRISQIPFSRISGQGDCGLFTQKRFY